MPERSPSPIDPRRLVRRALDAARDEKLDPDRVIDRMERDDLVDGSERLDPDSSELPLSGDSAYGSAFGSSRMSDEDSSEHPTLPEPQARLDATLEGIDSTSDEPNLSEAYPSSQRGRSTSRLTILSTPRYRPSRRPPMAVLRVYDDDQHDYEAIRIRQTPFVIGRQDGELVIGHERQMSRRHARIDRVQEGEAWRWYLADLRSTNGTFVRVPSVTLEDGMEVLCGGELVRFISSSAGGDELVRVAPQTDEERVQLKQGTHFLGSDATGCLDFLRSSPYLDPQHLRLDQVKGSWRIVDLDSTNHLWVAITKRTELISGSQFQIGEQRFELLLP